MVERVIIVFNYMDWSEKRRRNEFFLGITYLCTWTTINQKHKVFPDLKIMYYSFLFIVTMFKVVLILKLGDISILELG